MEVSRCAHRSEERGEVKLGSAAASGTFSGSCLQNLQRTFSRFSGRSNPEAFFFLLALVSSFSVQERAPPHFSPPSCSAARSALALRMTAPCVYNKLGRARDNGEAVV